MHPWTYDILFTLRIYCASKVCLLLLFSLYTVYTKRYIDKTCIYKNTKFSCITKSVSGFSDSGWERVQKTSPLDTRYLEFHGKKKEGTTQSQSRGDMAIDDLLVTRGPCKGEGHIYM